MTGVRKPQFRARCSLAIAGFDPSSRREIAAGEFFDATEEELRGLVLGRDYELSSKMRPLDRGVTGKKIADDEQVYADPHERDRAGYTLREKNGDAA